MKPLIIGGDFKDIRTVAKLKDRIADYYDTSRRGLNGYEFLIAYQDTGSWGCDSSSFFLLRGKKSGKYFEVHGAHCSCNGFEDQWRPEETTLARYLERDWYFPAGGYDDDSKTHRRMVLDRIRELANVPPPSDKERAKELAEKLNEAGSYAAIPIIHETIAFLRELADRAA